MTVVQSAETAAGLALAGAEVVELTSFSDKKTWIEQKIEFLAALPPVDACDPPPPAQARFSQTVLDAWWEEHDRIEAEVDEYDMGDLARMRQFARDKSKQALSVRDTDLIELTLSTLFAVDRLLHLLRQRRRALSLLRYRLEWERACALARERHRRIVDVVLPNFVRQTRPDLSALHPQHSNHAPASETAPSATDPGPERPLTRSLSLSLSLSSASALPRPHPHRAATAALALTTLKTDLRALADTLLPAAATSLDRWIDSSPQPLPDPFLDAQDRLEERVGRLAEGMEGFVEGCGRQAQVVEGISGRLKAVRAECADLAAAIPGPGTQLGPTRQVEVDGWRGRLAHSEEKLVALRQETARLPCPEHPLAVPDQPAANARLAAELGAALEAARVEVEKVRGEVERYEGEREVMSRVEAHGRAVLEVTARLKAFIDAAAEGNTDPSETAGAATASETETAASKDLATGRALVDDAVRLIGSARRAGVNLDSVRALKSATEDLRAVLGPAAALLARREREAQQARAREAALQATLEARRRCEEAEEALRAELERALWRPLGREHRDPAEGERAFSFEAFKRRVADLLAASGSQEADAEMAGNLQAGLETDEISALGQIAALDALVRRAREQRQAVRAFETEVHTLRRDLDASAQPQKAHPVATAAAAAAAAATTQIRGRFEALQTDLHVRIPFLADAGMRLDSPPLDLAAHDARVRAHVNELCATMAGMLETAERADEAPEPSSGETPAGGSSSDLPELPAPAREGESTEGDLVPRLRLDTPESASESGFDWGDAGDDGTGGEAWLRTPQRRQQRSSEGNRSRSTAWSATDVRPFSFDTPARRRGSLRASSRSGPLFTASQLTRSGSAASSSRASSRTTTTTTASSRRSTGAASASFVASSSTTRSRRSAQHSNALHGAVTAVMDAMPHVSIRVADGPWTDESGVYVIAGRTYFVRLLRSKRVMVRVGGGWLELSEFVRNQFGTAEGVTCSPTRSLSRSLSSSSDLARWATVPASAAASPERGLARPSGGLSLSASLQSLDEYMKAMPVSPAPAPASTIRTPIRKQASAGAAASARQSRPVQETGGGTARSSSRLSASKGPRAGRLIPPPPPPVWRP